MRTFRKFLTKTDLADSNIKVESSYGSLTVKIADCDKNVYLTFSYDKPKHIRESLKKLKVLEDGLAIAREELESKL